MIAIGTGSLPALDENKAAAIDELRWLAQQMRPPQIRTIGQFAEDEIVLPNGPYAGQRFKLGRQPYGRLFFREVDLFWWLRAFGTGPSQSGKTLHFFVIPILYHLFEIGETVVCGVPDDNMAADKWHEDIKPVLLRTRFAKYMPTRGGGSRGAKVTSIRFINGATLRFMTVGGADTSLAGYTSRIMVASEIHGISRTRASSSEQASKIKQLEARTRSYGGRRHLYEECIVTTEDGAGWQEYLSGSQGRIALPCPHCGMWASPGREHLVGWQDAESEVEAAELAQWQCPSCAKAWTEAERQDVNEAGVLLHRGQTIDERGNIHGERPAVRTLSFRYTATNNMLVTAGDVAADEWNAARAEDEESAEKEMRQFIWCMPYTPPSRAVTPLDSDVLTRRTHRLPQRMIPKEARYLTIGMDPGMYLIHWVALALTEEARPYVIDYACEDVPTKDVGLDRALLLALRNFRDHLDQAGWLHSGIGPKRPDMILIDSGWMPDIVYSFCRESGEPFYPSKGYGASQDRAVIYRRPKATNATVRFIGEEYHMARLRKEQVDLYEYNADHWKTWAHERLRVPIDAPDAMTFFAAGSREHLTFVKHVTAEEMIEEFIRDRGTVRRMKQRRKRNHFLDALAEACVAGHRVGARLSGKVEDQPSTGQSWFSGLGRKG